MTSVDRLEVSRLLGRRLVDFVAGGGGSLDESAAGRRILSVIDRGERVEKMLQIGCGTPWSDHRAHDAVECGVRPGLDPRQSGAILVLLEAAPHLVLRAMQLDPFGDPCHAFERGSKHVLVFQEDGVRVIPDAEPRLDLGDPDARRLQSREATPLQRRDDRPGVADDVHEEAGWEVVTPGIRGVHVDGRFLCEYFDPPTSEGLVSLVESRHKLMERGAGTKQIVEFLGVDAAVVEVLAVEPLVGQSMRRWIRSRSASQRGGHEAVAPGVGLGVAVDVEFRWACHARNRVEQIRDQCRS